MLRAYTDLCIFRPLQKLWVPFFRHRRREPAIPPCAGKAPLSPSVRTGDFPRRGKQGPLRASAPTGRSPPGEGVAGRRGRRPLRQDGTGVFPLLVNRRADTPVDSSPRGGEPSGPIGKPGESRKAVSWFFYNRVPPSHRRPLQSASLTAPPVGESRATAPLGKEAIAKLASGRFVNRPYGEAGRGHLIRPSVRTEAPSPPGEGIFTGCRQLVRFT